VVLQAPPGDAQHLSLHNSVVCADGEHTPNESVSAALLALIEPQTVIPYGECGWFIREVDALAVSRKGIAE
jgi:hypothetical protein